MQPSLMDISQQETQEIPAQEVPEPSYPQEMPQEQYPEQYPQQYPQTQQQGIEFRSQMDEVEALIESVIDEKWQSMISNVGDLNLWKQKTRTDIQSIKQEIMRLEARFENLEKAILGKVSEYDKNVGAIGSEMRALEKVFQKILQPLTTNIKELQRITTNMKSRRGSAE